MSQSSLPLKPSTKISIYTSVTPLIFILQILGHVLFSINPKTWRAEIRKTNIFISMIFIVTTIGLHYVYWSSHFRYELHPIEMARNIIPKLVYGTVIVYSVVNIWIFLSRHKIVQFLRKIHEVDEKFKHLGVHFDYQDDRRKLIKILAKIFFLVIAGTITGLITQQYYTRKVDTTSLILLKFFRFKIGTLLIFQIIIGMIAIRRRFAAINEFLKYKINHKISDIKTLSEIHLMLTDSIEIFNLIYGPIILLYIAIGFGWFCLFIFLSVMMCLRPRNYSTFIAIYNTIVNIALLVTIFLIIYHSERTRKEGLKTKKLLYKMLSKNECKLLRESIQEMIFQISDTKNEFSCGLVDFNWKFLFKVSLK